MELASVDVLPSVGLLGALQPGLIVAERLHLHFVVRKPVVHLPQPVARCGVDRQEAGQLAPAMGGRVGSTACFCAARQSEAWLAWRAGAAHRAVSLSRESGSYDSSWIESSLTIAFLAEKDAA